MKSVLIASMLSSVLFSAIIETGDGTFLNIYADRGPKSSVVATVSADKGKISKKHCFTIDNNEEWCKVNYKYNGLTLKGYSDKKSLDILASRLNTKSYFEMTYGGQYDDIANKVLPLRDGYLLVGSTQSFGAGQTDAYVMKVDKFGNKIWSSTYGGRQNDFANSAVAVDGGFMLAGTTNSFGSRVQSIYLAKISGNGALAWQHGYYSDNDDYYYGEDIINIGNDNTLVVGTEDHVKFFNSEVNIYVNAVNTKGQRNGIKRYGGEDEERAKSIIEVSDGYVIAGETDTWTHGRKDAYVVKIDKNGNRIWHNAFGFRYDEIANQVISTRDGGYITIGTTDSDISNQKDMYVVKIDANGNRQWQYHYGSRENEEGYGIVEVNDGYVMTGYTKDTKNYDSDAYIVKIDKEGNVLWHKRYGGEKDDEARAIIKVNGGFVVVGYSTSSENYSKDMYLIKVDDNGNM